MSEENDQISHEVSADVHRFDISSELCCSEVTEQSGEV